MSFPQPTALPADENAMLKPEDRAVIDAALAANDEELDFVLRQADAIQSSYDELLERLRHECEAARGAIGTPRLRA